MDSKKAEKEPFANQTSQDDNFYDTAEIPSPEYDNAVNQAATPVDPEERARQEEEWKNELAKLEDEITTLKQVLSAKVRQSSELKHKLGITPLKTMQKDLTQGIQNIKGSEAYQKSTAALKTAGTKTTSAFSTFGQFTSRKIGDMRNSNAFKSFEEKVGGAYNNVKTRVRGSKSEQNFEDVLNSTAAAEAESRGASSTPATPAEEKVPL